MAADPGRGRTAWQAEYQRHGGADGYPVQAATEASSSLIFVKYTLGMRGYGVGLSRVDRLRQCITGSSK